MVIPEEMIALFADFPSAKENFHAFPNSAKRGILEWIYSAKKPKTQAKCIRETMLLAQPNIGAN
jgi:uncharacterized protein YdeI (YjbR/CyaY-like superfamily)